MTVRTTEPANPFDFMLAGIILVSDVIGTPANNIQSQLTDSIPSTAFSSFPASSQIIVSNVDLTPYFNHYHNNSALSPENESAATPLERFLAYTCPVEELISKIADNSSGGIVTAPSSISGVSVRRRRSRRNRKTGSVRAQYSGSIIVGGGM